MEAVFAGWVQFPNWPNMKIDIMCDNCNTKNMTLEIEEISDLHDAKCPTCGNASIFVTNVY